MADGIRDPSTMPAARIKFYKSVEVLESLLAETEGPFVLGEKVSLCDLELVPNVILALQSLPKMRGEDVVGNERYPAITRFVETLEKLPEYQFVGGGSLCFYFSCCLSCDMLV